MRNQRTIKNPVTIQGTGLHSGDDITVTLRPAEVDTGVVFIRTDLPGKPRIPLRRESVLQKDRQTAIAEGHAEVQTVEHLAASLLALGVDNVEGTATINGDDSGLCATAVEVTVNSGIDWGAWANGVYTRCTAEAPCGALDVHTLNGRAIYVKAAANSTDPTHAWYYAYVYAYCADSELEPCSSDTNLWVLQYVSPALKDVEGDYMWNAHRYLYGKDPWSEPWGDNTVAAIE